MREKNDMGKRKGRYGGIKKGNENKESDKQDGK